MKEMLLEGSSRRGSAMGRWKERIKKYMSERVASREF